MAAVGVASLFILAKGLAWVKTGSVSLQAALIDSVLDAAASLINLYAIRKAQKPPTRDFRFGHGKAEAIAALGQTVFIILSALWILYEAYQHFITPAPLVKTWIGIWVMLFSLILTYGLLVLQKTVVDLTGSMAIKADSIHYRTDFLIHGSVLITLLINLKWSILWLDALVGAIISLYILYTVGEMMTEALGVLMDKELSVKIRNKVSDIVLQHPEVKGLHELRTRSSGLRKFIQLHLELDGNITLNEAHKIADQVEKMILQDIPEADVLIHEDPEGIFEQHRFQKYSET